MDQSSKKQAEPHEWLSLADKDRLLSIAHALDSPSRLDVLDIISRRPMISVSDIAKVLNMPMATASVSVKLLEEVGIIKTVLVPGKHGDMRLCWIYSKKFLLSFSSNSDMVQPFVKVDIPIGSYIAARDISPSCGMNAANEIIGQRDIPAYFYDAERYKAQLIWFNSGFLDYRIMIPEKLSIRCLEIAFEACSEVPGFKNDWPSDISLYVSNHLLGKWTSPSDCGGRHGLHTPSWWADKNTQFGFLKTWRVDSTGTFLDSERIGDVTLSDVLTPEQQFLDFSIGVSPNALHCGGINLFGEQFGDTGHGLKVRFGV